MSDAARMKNPARLSGYLALLTLEEKWAYCFADLRARDANTAYERSAASQHRRYLADLSRQRISRNRQNVKERERAAPIKLATFDTYLEFEVAYGRKR